MIKKKSVWTICFALFWTVLTPAQAQQKENLKQIEDYLNNIKTMQASFVQTASNGNTAEGMLYIAKPNKIRMEYNAPTNVLIVGDGDYIIYHDKELDQVTNIDYDDIPASLILANDVKLDGKKIQSDQLLSGRRHYHRHHSIQRQRHRPDYADF